MIASLICYALLPKLSYMQITSVQCIDILIGVLCVIFICGLDFNDFVSSQKILGERLEFVISFNAFPVVLWYIVAFLYIQHISICYDDVLMLSSFFDATLLHLFVYNTFLYVMIIAAFQIFLPSVDSLLMGKSDQNIKASLFYCCFSRIPTKC